ncbi:polycomb group protein Psc-like [Cloeon dipterum]|uniref:polycomb group protein Psc-like n=1 Tax=Cloeon dipterum TaxID=197152 RepID=UPI00321FAE0D
MSPSKVQNRPRVKELRSHLICGICMGYFVDATTINECLHTFCRSCIVKYLDTSNYCPMCDVQIHKSKPLQNLRPDKILQDIVYKVVPGFYASEVKSRREFYENAKEKGLLTPEADSLMTPELRGELHADSQHFSPDESISLSLEYYTHNDESNNDESRENEDKEEDAELEEKPNPTRRYYKCPAAVCIRILKKLLRSKYSLRETDKVDIIYNGECLPEHFTLMDVGYIFTYKKKRLLKFYFRFYSKPPSETAAAVKSVKRPIADNADNEVKRPRVSSEEASGTQAADERSAEQQISQPVATSTRSSSPGPLEEPEKRPVKEKSPVARLPSPKRSVEEEKKEQDAPPAKKPKLAEAPVVVETAKPASEPPKPIQPGLKPPSQTSLLLKQQIAQQREQQKKMQMKQQQQQHMLKLQRQQQQLMKQAKTSTAGQPKAQHQQQDKSVVMVKQMPQLQKMAAKPVAKNAARPVMPQPTTASIGTQSLPIVSKTVEAAPAPKPSSQSSKPAQSSQTEPPPINTAEQRRLTTDMIEKNKLRPVVVIERHGNGRPKVKQVPSPLKLHQQMSREFNKAIAPEQSSTPKASQATTTLTTAPTDSATKVKIVKTPTPSPETTKKPVAEPPKQAASPSEPAGGETPKGKSGDDCALDLSGKSSRKSDSPRSSVGSPSPPAPKIPSPEPRKSLPQQKPPPPPPPPQQTPTPPPKPQAQPQHSKPPAAAKQPATHSLKKDQNIIKIAQNSLNEKFSFFRQYSPAATAQSMDAAALSKITSYHNLLHDAQMRSKQHQHFKALSQQHQQQQQQQQRAVRPQQAKPSTYGPRAGSQAQGRDTIRIPMIGKASADSATRRMQDLFASPQPKPGPNQAVRHIPNPSLLGRQNVMRMQQPPAMDPAAVRKDEITITPARNPAAASTGMASPTHVSSLRKIETLTQSLQRSICESKMAAAGMSVVASDAAQ